MIYLIFAILCGASITLIFRLSVGKYTNRYALLCGNYITCIVVAFLFLEDKRSIIPTGSNGMLALKLGMVNGVLYLAGIVLNHINVKLNGAIMTSTFSRLGLLFPMIGSIVILGEIPNVVQLVGIILAVFAIVYINGSEKKEISQQNVTFKAGLLMMLIISGVSEGMSKVFEQVGSREWDDRFLLYTFAMALILCTLLFIKSGGKAKPIDLLFGIGVGILNYMSSRFALKALTLLPAYIVYSSISICTILVVSIVSVFLFKDKLTKRQTRGVIIIMVAVLLLNL